MPTCKSLSALRAPAVAMLVLLLGACGSNPTSDGASDTERENRQASGSVAGLFMFASAQINSATGDTSEPRSIDGITPPVDDFAEPFTL